MSNTPECDKMRKAREKGSQIIGEFLEWCESNGIVLSSVIKEEDEIFERWCPINKRREQILADFFGVDLDKCEEERQAILEELRSKQ